jgi:hypothetical protein
MHKNEGTIRDIARQENLSTQRIYQAALEAGFPSPLYVVGKNKIYDLRQVARYFARRADRRRGLRGRDASDRQDLSR